MPLWERAEEAYAVACKLYRLNDWDQAGSAFDQFLQTYPTNENAPLACLQRAHCLLARNEFDGGLAMLEEVTKRFGDSCSSEYAWGKMLSFAHAKKQYDRFLDLYEKMTARFGGAPLNVSDRVDWRRVGSYQWRISHTYFHWPRVRTSVYLLSAANPKMGWVQNLLDAADTPPRASRALAIVEKTLAAHGDDLPADWKYAHVILLRRSADASSSKATSKARKQFEAYLHVYPKNDPRRMAFWLFEAGYWRDRDPAKTDVAWEVLTKHYPGFDSLEEPAARRINDLYRQRRYDDCVQLARWYLEHFPLGRRRDTAMTRWIDLAKDKARQGDVSSIAPALAALDGEQKRYSLDARRVRKALVWRIELALAGGKNAEAIPLARKLISDAYWSARSFRKIESLARTNEAFAPILAEARTKRGIPALDEKSPAKALYQNLQARIRQNQVRHMEELGETMFHEYRHDAYTLLAIRALVKYYYGKALHSDRDRWVGVMVEAYPYHPLTQAVLTRQSKALLGAKEFPRAAELLDTALRRFPGAEDYDRWFRGRVQCFKALKQYPQRVAFCHRLLDPRIAAGEILAIGWMGDAEEDVREPYEEQGDYWMEQYPTWGLERPQGLYCLQRAFSSYYITPLRQWRRNLVAYLQAAFVAHKLRQQTFRPELRWRMTFEDINLLSYGKLGDKALPALQARLRDMPKTLHLSELLDLPNFGWAVGQAKLAGAVQKVFQQIGAQCKLPSDRVALHLMLGNLYSQAGMPIQAAEYYLQAGRTSARRPIDCWAMHQEAMRCLATEKSSPYLTQQVQYITQIKTAQDVVPGLLLNCVRFCTKNKNSAQAEKFLHFLRKEYPASAERGAAEREMIEK